MWVCFDTPLSLPAVFIGVCAFGNVRHRMRLDV
jgi:hypothetical protein